MLKMRTRSHEKIFVLIIFVVLFCVTTAAPAGYPLHAAAERGDVAEVERLLAEIIDGRDKNGETPLHFAAWHGRTEVVIILLQRGADVNAKTKEGKIPAMFAAEVGHQDLAEFLKIKQT